MPAATAPLWNGIALSQSALIHAFPPGDANTTGAAQFVAENSEIAQ